MALRDLQAFLEDDGLEYPLQASAFGDPSKHPDGKTYRVPSPDAKTGLWLTALADLGVRASQGGDLAPDDLASLKLDDDKERSLYQRVLGPVYDEMVADGVKYTALQTVAQDAYLCFAMSSEIADGALESLGKAQPNRRQRRAAKRPAGPRSRRASTGSATPTPPPGSTGSSTSPAEPGAAAAG
jgi:hypothetical protein